MEETATNSSVQIDGEILPLREQRWFKILICTLYGIIFAVGVTGNAAVIFTISQRKKLKTVTNLFILNLAVSDLIFSGSIPLEFPLILEDYAWPYASFFCKLYSPAQTIAVSVSIFTLTAVSCIRYRAIILPLRSQVSRGAAKCILVGLWAFSSLLMVPYFLVLKMKGATCGEEWPHISYRKTYTTLLFCFFYIIPLSIILFTYTKIVIELKKKKNYQNAALDEVRTEETSKVVNMLIKVTSLFAICNLPSQIMWLWLDFGSADKTFTFFWDLLAALNIFIFANSAANPFIYYMYHDKFRNEVSGYLQRFRRILRRFSVSRSDRKNSSCRGSKQLCHREGKTNTCGSRTGKLKRETSTLSGISVRLLSLGAIETQETTDTVL